MSSRPKAFLKQAKSKHKKEQRLETADDYQAAGVEHEDAAGKWRAGDPVKSMRFFQRALEVYDQGLVRFPKSLDLAYNKARVQLEIATHPILVRQLEVSVINALEIALQSHRYALGLDEQNADSLFNTAQVLTSIAEEIAKNDQHPDTDALQLLREALELQARCLSLQELKYEENRVQQEFSASTQLVENNSDNDEDGGADILTQNSSSAEEQWFSIVEPVTIETLIDTVLAQLDTLTTLCEILNGLAQAISEDTLSWVEQYSNEILNKRIPAYLKQSSTQITEISLARIAFISSLLEAGLRSSRIDLRTYIQELKPALNDPIVEKNTSPEAQITKARIMLSYNTCLSDFTHYDKLQDQQKREMNLERWNNLNKVITILTQVAKDQASTSEEKFKAHFLRGDASLLQNQMKYSPIEYNVAKKNSKQLLINAETFYRNAYKLADSTGNISPFAVVSNPNLGITTSTSVNRTGASNQNVFQDNEDDEKSIAGLRMFVSKYMLQQLSVEEEAVITQADSSPDQINIDTNSTEPTLSNPKPNAPNDGKISLDKFVKQLRSDPSISERLAKRKSPEWILKQIGEMVDDGLVFL